MSRANEMLDILDRECRELEESLLSDICDKCHCPHTMGQEELDETCSECSIAQDLEGLLEKTRTVATGRVMQIVSEEMHPEKKGE